MALLKVTKVKERSLYNALLRFEHAIEDGKEPDEEAIQAAVEAAKEKRLRLRRKYTGRYFDVSSPEYAIALEYVRRREAGENAYDDAVSRFMASSGLGELQSKKYLRDLTRRIEKYLAIPSKADD